jgi:hypothetical protein
MQITITEVNDVEGVWVESEEATYPVAYEDEVRELASAFGSHFAPEQYEDALVFLSGMVGMSAEAPAFLVEAEELAADTDWDRPMAEHEAEFDSGNFE